MMTGVNFCMPAQWTGELIGEMHLKGVTAKELAAEAGWHPKYLSAVLNGHRAPKKAEVTLSTALNRILSNRQAAN